MNNLGLILKHLYPNADPLRDYRVQDDGAGPYIAEWDEAKLGPRPTQEELDAVDVAKIEHNARIDAQIKALEASRPGYVRGVREFMLGMALIAKQQGGPDLMLTAGMQNVKALDDQIKALRAQRQ
jgi:hypothetical protein